MCQFMIGKTWVEVKTKTNTTSRSKGRSVLNGLERQRENQNPDYWYNHRVTLTFTLTIRSQAVCQSTRETELLFFTDWVETLQSSKYIESQRWMEEVMSNPPLPVLHKYTHMHTCAVPASWSRDQTLDAGLELKLKQWWHQTFSVATETRSALTLCERGRGFHASPNTSLTHIPSAVTYSAVWVFLLFPVSMWS